MSVLKGEGKFPILFGSTSIAVGPVTHTGYLARPDLSGEWPTVVLVPSAHGVTSNVKDLARRLARQGFAAVAPDLYRGRAPRRFADDDEARAAFGALGERRPVADLEAIAGFIRNPAGFWSNAELGAGLFLVGEGAGVGLAAARAFGPAAVAMAYPVGVSALADRLRAIGSAPLLGLAGRDDELVPVDDVMAARAAAPHAEWVLYDGVGHAFLDDSREAYDRETAMDALERVSDFFEKHLPPQR